MTWHHCGVGDCKYKANHKGNLKRHKADVHNIGVTWHYCDEEGCEYKSKQNCHLTKHKQEVHNIGATWHHCNEEGCEYKSTRNGNLTKHKKQVHDIGDNICGFCWEKRNSQNFYEDKQGEHLICRECYEKKTGKKSRDEKIWSDYIDKNLGTQYLTSSDKSLKSQGGCQLYRPDKLYIGIDTVEVDELDEHQHKYNNGNYTCDEKRISDIYEEDGIVGKKMIVCRMNPDKYTVPTTQKTMNERLSIFVKFKKYIRTNPPKEHIHIYYFFYDKNNPRISQRYPHTLFFDDEDFK